MLLRISPAGEVLTEQPTGPLDEHLAASLHAAELTAYAITPDLTLIAGPRRRHSTNAIATRLATTAGHNTTITGPAALLCCERRQIVDHITTEALDALSAAGALAMNFSTSPNDMQARATSEPLSAASKPLTAAAAANEITARTGHEIRLDDDSSVRTLLADELGLPLAPETPINDASLRELNEQHPTRILELLIHWRSAQAS